MQGVIQARTYGKFIKARVPDVLGEDLKAFCQIRGFKVQDFVADAIREKLLRERKVAG